MFDWQLYDGRKSVAKKHDRGVLQAKFLIDVDKKLLGVGECIITRQPILLFETLCGCADHCYRE